jgi:hypothetical protein
VAIWSDVALALEDRIRDESRTDLLRAFYDVDWADPASRRIALGRVERHLAPHFRWIVASRYPALRLARDELSCVGETLEADFLNYRLSPSSAEEKESIVVVAGWVDARTRRSREALRRPFSDQWRFEHGLAVELESS